MHYYVYRRRAGTWAEGASHCGGPAGAVAIPAGYRLDAVPEPGADLAGREVLLVGPGWEGRRGEVRVLDPLAEHPDSWRLSLRLPALEFGALLLRREAVGSEPETQPAPQPPVCTRCRFVGHEAPDCPRPTNGCPDCGHEAHEAHEGGWCRGGRALERQFAAQGITLDATPCLLAGRRRVSPVQTDDLDDLADRMCERVE